MRRKREFNDVARGMNVGNTTPNEIYLNKGIVEARPVNEESLMGLALSCFKPGVEVPAGTVVAAVRAGRNGVAAKTESVHVALSKLVARGKLVRVRFGVYRLPAVAP